MYPCKNPKQPIGTGLYGFAVELPAVKLVLNQTEMLDAPSYYR